MMQNILRSPSHHFSRVARSKPFGPLKSGLQAVRCRIFLLCGLTCKPIRSNFGLMKTMTLSCFRSIFNADRVLDDRPW